MAASGFGHLGLDGWRSLFRLREARVPVTEIASRLGRHRSTIYRELARNRSATLTPPGTAGATCPATIP